MRRSNTEKDVTALVKGTNEVSSMPRRFSVASRLNERRKSLPVEQLQDDIQKLNFSREEKILTIPRPRASSSKQPVLHIYVGGISTVIVQQLLVALHKLDYFQ